MIRRVGHQDIDKQAWDSAVRAAANRSWYANSFVLDRMSPAWEALIDDVTGAFMPLTKRRKYGIDYLFQPFALQQLGIFAPGPITTAISSAFLRAVPSTFRLVQIAGNEAMPLTHEPGWSFAVKNDHLLDLTGGMGQVRAGYAKNTVRNLAKSEAASTLAMPSDQFVRFYSATTLERFPGQDAQGVAALAGLLNDARSRGELEILGFQDSGGNFCGALALVHWQGRTILLKSGATERGRELNAMFHLVDRALETSAARSATFDFAGSDHPGTARFYSSFGAEPSTYFRLERNTLPFWAKLFKR